jgi:glycosyltransferase involved in cell wall biosynthesis
VVPWCDRPELAETLAANADVVAAHKAEVLIVNLGGAADALECCIRKATRVRVARVAGPFNKSRACNVGVRMARARRVMCLDADVVLLPDTLEALGRHVAPGVAAHVAEVRETRPVAAAGQELVYRAHTLTVRLRDGREASVTTSAFHPLRGTRSGIGLLAAMREDLLAVGGWNAALTGWGFEDCDLALRLQLAGVSLRQAGGAIHSTHIDALPAMVGLTRAESDERNLRRALDHYARGDLAGSLEQDARGLDLY